LSGGYGDREGRYAGNRIQPFYFGSLGGNALETLDAYHLATVGVDHASSMLVVFRAPPASRAFSPVTTLIDWAQSQDAVKRAFGLDNGVFSLSTDPDLAKYDAITALASPDEDTRREGARVAAANLRAMAVAAAAERMGQEGFDPSYTQFRYQIVGEHIASRPNSFLFTNAQMSDLLAAAAPPGRYRADVISAAAHLVDAYAAALGVQVADIQQAARYTLGIRGYLLEELDVLLRANSAAAAAAAQAVATGHILDRTVRYREALPFPAGFFFPGPDFFSVAAGTQISVPSSGSGNGSVTANDFYANGPSGSIGFFIGSSQTLSVSVPAANAGQVGAELRADNTILITPKAGFTGVTYFDYVARHNTGDQATGRVYVTVR
jgi:hypothetical protein